MTASEFTEWKAFARICPIGMGIEDWNALNKWCDERAEEIAAEEEPEPDPEPEEVARRMRASLYQLKQRRFN